MLNSLAPIIIECERLIAAACSHFRLSIQPSEVIVTIQTRGKLTRALGWFSGERWENTQNKPIHEINLSAEWLKQNDARETLLHELAHAENHKKGIQDVAGSRHNKKFKAMAEQLGLLVKKPTDHRGFAYTSLGPDANAFLTKFAFKRELFQLARLATEANSSPGSRLIKCVCPDCGYTIRTAQKWINVGLTTCPCGSDIEPEP